MSGPDDTLIVGRPARQHDPDGAHSLLLILPKSPSSHNGWSIGIALSVHSDSPDAYGRVARCRDWQFLVQPVCRAKRFPRRIRRPTDSPPDPPQGIDEIAL